MTTRQRSTSSTSTDPPARGEVVLGVDTHGEVHVAAAVRPLGQILGTESFPATAAEGLSNADIGARIHLSAGTVKDHVSSILTRLRVSSRVQAALLAERAGLLGDNHDNRDTAARDNGR